MRAAVRAGRAARRSLDGYPARVHRRRRFLSLFAIAAIVAGCLGQSDPSSAFSPEASPSPLESAVASPSPDTSVEPSMEPSLEPSDPASPSPGTSPASSTDPAIGPAAACTGNDDNKDFFAGIAEAVAWTVYCPVLPTGWFVVGGSYQLAGGGQFEIDYRGPGGARFGVQEGAFCTDGASVCAPRDEALGPAAFGDLEGELAILGDAFVIYVDPGSAPMWQATGTRMDEPTFRSYAEALAIVEG